MVCPVCVATAVMANAPAIAAGLVGGAAAVKLAWQRKGVVCKKDAEVVQGPTTRRVSAPVKDMWWTPTGKVRACMCLDGPAWPKHRHEKQRHYAFVLHQHIGD